MAKEDKKAKKINKVNKKNLFNIVMITAILLIICYILYTILMLILKPTDIVMIENGTIYSEESTAGYVIREETIIKGNNYENGLVEIKTEGEKVAKGESIFRYYSQNEESLNNKIAEVNTKIQEALAGQTDLFSSDIKSLENQIAKKIEGLKVKNDIQEINEYKKDINTYITKKAKIAGELSSSGSYINELINEKLNYENELRSNSEYVDAPVSGVVSYRVDNLETILTPNNFTNLNKDFLDNLNLKTGQIISTNKQVGKVINNFECYIVVVTDSDKAKEAKVRR